MVLCPEPPTWLCNFPCDVIELSIGLWALPAVRSGPCTGSVDSAEGTQA